MSQFNDHMNQKAVALTYDEDVNAAPVVVASGSGYIAQKIVETARNNGIPVFEDNSLATMLSQLELGSEIPEQLYQAIVEIYVYFLNFSPKKARPSDPQAAAGAQAASGSQGDAGGAPAPQAAPQDGVGAAAGVAVQGGVGAAARPAGIQGGPRRSLLADEPDDLPE